MAVVSQNHEYCQNALVEMKSIPTIIHLVDDTTSGIIEACGGRGQKATSLSYCIFRMQIRSEKKLSMLYHVSHEEMRKHSRN